MLRTMVVAGLTVTALAVPAGAAEAAPAQSASGDVQDVLDIHFSATRPAGAAPGGATGTLSARWTAGPLTFIDSLEANVNCLDVRGNRFGLYVDIVASSPSSVADTPGGGYFSGTVDATGKVVSSIWYPVPYVRTSSHCAPLPAGRPASGHVALSS